MTDDAPDSAIAKLLRNRTGLLGISGVVFRDQLQLDLPTANLQPFRIGLVNRHTHCIFRAFAELGQ